jgi:SAM-dependent methyltransferase
MLAVPPPEYIYLATSGNDTEIFLATGAADQQHVVSAIDRAGVEPASGRLRILDWGCGCGRIARHWDSTGDVELYGCDVAEGPVKWCQENLRFGRFAVSRHDPLLPYRDAFFDVVYAASVLTHLTLESQFRWMQEIWRVLRPSGIAMLTTHGPSMFPRILPAMGANAQRTSVTLIDEEMFICLNDEVGSNSAGAVQTRGMTERIFRPFAMLDYWPRFGFMGIQDTNLLRKNGGPEPMIRDALMTVPMSGNRFQVSFETDLHDASTFCLLVEVPDLVYPAQAVMRVGDRCGEAVRIPTMAKWTGLAAAYVSLIVTDCGYRAGRTTVTVDVSCDKALDCLTLNVPKLIAC